MNLQTIIIFLNLSIALVIIVASRDRERVPSAVAIITMAVATALWAWCDLLLRQPSSIPAYASLAAALLLSSTAAASAQLVFVIHQSNRQHWITRLPIGLLAIVPALTLFVYLIKPWHPALFGSAELHAGTLLFHGSIWGKIVIFYVFSLIGASVVLLWNAFLERPRSLWVPFGAVLLGTVFPLLSAALEFAGLGPLSSAELLPVGFTLAAVTYAYYLFQPREDMLASIDRNAVVEGMDDGWMVLDNDNVVVDMNAAAERMAGLARAQVLGKPVTGMLGSLPNLGQAFDHSQELEMKRSIRSEDGWKYLNIRISPLNDHDRRPFGRLALWHDVTERKLTEDARQRARDEMLVLLNAISSAASNVVDLDDFLSESIYHIIYPFRSQVVCFFLADEKKDKEEARQFALTAHLGLSADASAQLALVPASSQPFAALLVDRQPVQIEEVDQNAALPAAWKTMELACLLVIPLVTQAGENGEVLGCMCLARKDKPIFSQDETVRLTMIADQIAALIENDRRRKLAITSTERKRLMRDLHDSLSQKLYGLVTLTEAAQASIEAGNQVDPAEILTRIGENARQAVKEMRLFLFQMQPIDMEKDGLISLLHHRLAAVEGRADIKARLRADLTDEELALSRETQVVLYYIAQEGLNNVLRHAAARSVSVTLKQGSRNVILEILDDGCGFDPKKVERGGLGLTNMRERTSQIHGKIQIASQPEQGAKVVITVPRDPSVKLTKHRR
ncbi:MAG TPA: histidine kinase N-terminal 7TM domain-containing protein [Anaerolineales bacterium]|nr:histidine kinase N-terminal 7TM domain-containing protein [Anaerolineales bacterium]